jgi:hypothetical protein
MSSNEKAIRGTSLVIFIGLTRNTLQEPNRAKSLHLCPFTDTRVVVARSVLT